MKKVRNMLWGVKFRLSLLYHYLFNGTVRRRTAWREMVYHLLSPAMYTVARQKATLTNKDDKYAYYRIKGYQDTFIYPVSAPLYSLAMILAEARPRHWHYYEIPQTAIAPGDVIVDCGSAEGFSHSNISIPPAAFLCWNPCRCSWIPCSSYLVKGIHYLSGNPVMLHMWI